jgi:hypothetical protein
MSENNPRKDSNPLRSFLIRVNENFIYRSNFIKDPIAVIEELLEIELSDKKKEQIHKLRQKLMEATGGVFNIPTDAATLNLLKQLRNEDVDVMGDDSIIL